MNLIFPILFILYFLNLATLMYALFERIGDEDESSGESQVLTDPCDVEKTTVIMVKLAQRSRSYFLKDNQTQHTIKRREAFNVTETFNQTKADTYLKMGKTQVYKLIFVQMCVTGPELSCISKENISSFHNLST